MNFLQYLWKELILLILHLETYLISVLDCFEEKINEELLLNF